MTDEEGGYRLVLEFDTDDPEFARGFEAGRLWSSLDKLPPEVQSWRTQVHTTNMTMILRAGEAAGFPHLVVEEVCLDGVEMTDWTGVTLHRDLPTVDGRPLQHPED